MRWLGFVALLLGCAEHPTCGGAALEPLAEQRPTYAVVSSDYASTAIALLDARGEVLREAWLDSGTAPAGIVATLSGDVSLPGAPFDECTLVLIDRYHTDVVTFLDVCGQSPVRAQVPIGEDSNPHDVLRVGEAVWVTRYRQDDIAVVDLAAARVVDTIPLGALAGEHGRVQPSRLALLEHAGASRVIIGAARLATDFVETSEGAVGVMDPDSRALSVLALEPLRNCAEVDPMPGEPSRALITCAGATFYASHEARRAHAGLVLVELSGDGEVRELARYAAADHPELPVPYLGTVPLSDGRAWSAASGEVGGEVDRGLVIDLHAGSGEIALSATDAYVLGEGAHDPTHDLLLVPDAAEGVVRRIEGGAEAAPVSTAGCRGLPPREIARLR